MYTRRTGGARYVPDFARSKSDWRFASRFFAYSAQVCPSTPGAPSLRVRWKAACEPVDVHQIGQGSESHLRRSFRQLGYPLLFREYAHRISRYPAYVPTTSSMIPMPRFPPRGPRGRCSPASSVLSRHCDFLPSLPPHFVAFAWRYHGNTHRFAPAAAACGRRRAWGWSPGIPVRDFFRGDDRISQVPGEPQFPFAHVLRPRPADASQTIAERSRGPR